MYFLLQKSLVVLCWVIATVLAVGEKQLKLEDIERENIANEKKVKVQKQSKAKLSTPTLQSFQKVISPSRLEYGFSPLKAAQKYTPQPQQQAEVSQAFQYAYPQYTTQYSTPLTYTQFPQYQYQQYENIPFVADNQLVQSAKSDHQQYYGQQLIYIQPTVAPTNNIQMVVDANGKAKYYMYIPNQYYNNEGTDINDPIKNIQVQTIPPTYNNVGPQIFTREPDYQQLPQNEHQYITQPQLPPQPVTHPIQYVEPTPRAPQQIQYISPTPAAPQQIQYISSKPVSLRNTQFVSPTPTQEPFVPSPQVTPQTLISKSQYTSKGEPQSLLDSYVPSILQLQYYKQQQEAQINSIEANSKLEVPKRILTRQTLRIPNAQVDTSYSLPLPSPYRANNFKS